MTAILQLHIFSWFDRNTIRHLRIPFSLLLMPVYMFALSQADQFIWPDAVAGFLILHFLLFPSTNGYNSYEDRDSSSIGGLKYPPRVSRNLFKVTLVMDFLAIGSGFWISFPFVMMTTLFIVMSRVYSFRQIRLKKYPVSAFIIVFIFQGGFVYLMASESITHVFKNHSFSYNHLICMLISSFFMGSMYPLTQIYQHESDRKDGIVSISAKLGYFGTFVFSGVLFALGTGLMCYYFLNIHQAGAILLFAIFIIPVVLRMAKWFNGVKSNPLNADYDHTMQMNRWSAWSMNLFFITLFVINITANYS
jgi:1,4-dihydroxy-2-naphthoate polyprenyltransferase